MNEVDLANHIRKVWRYAELLQLGEVFSGPVALKPSSEFVRRTRDSNASYEEVYLCGLKLSQYNILLKDYAFFQFGFGSQDSLRYAYYPNPFLGTSAAAVADLNERFEYVEEGIIELEEYLHGISELRYSQHPPLVRYENAPAQYVELKHPCSHFHFGHHADSRWPVRRTLTPSAFGLMLMKHFYSEQWNEAAELGVIIDTLSPDDRLARARDECQLLPDNLFTNRESRQFSFD